MKPLRSLLWKLGHRLVFLGDSVTNFGWLVVLKFGTQKEILATGNARLAPLGLYVTHAIAEPVTTTETIEVKDAVFMQKGDASAN